MRESLTETSGGMTEHESTADDVSRRNILKTTGAAGAAGLTGLSGCLSSLTGGTATVELLHGWSGGDGKAAFDAMADGFRENSDTELDVKAIGGSGNTSLDTRISQRIKNGNPPSSWAEWPGANLTQFTDDDVLGDIEGDVWTDEVKDAYLEGPKAAAKVGGNFVAVPRTFTASTTCSTTSPSSSPRASTPPRSTARWHSSTLSKLSSPRRTRSATRTR